MKHLMILTAVSAAALLAGPARAGDDPKPAPAAPGAPAAPDVAAKHENKITPEAKAAFEKMEKISNSPVKQGLKEASGTISMDMMGMAMTMQFSFKAPDAIHVEPDPNAEGPMKMGGQRMANGLERSLKPMLGIFRPGDDEEYDASFASKDGKDVLSVTNFKDGAERSHTDFTLDANGLPATATVKSQMEMRTGQKHEMSTDLTFTWEKSGDVYRLAKFESNSAGGGGGGGGAGGGGRGGMGGGGKVTLTYTYTPVEKFAIATSWTMEVPGGMTFESRMSDLTVNGKKVEIKAPEGGKKAPKKKGDDEDGEDDGEKDGK